MEDIIKFLGGASLLLAAVAWLIRSLTGHLLSKDIDVFKNQLKSEAEKELAMLTASLQLDNERLRIKLSVLESRRLEVLEELFSRLTHLTKRAEIFSWGPELNDIEELRKDGEKFYDSYISFYQYFEEHSIFLPKTLESDINFMHDNYYNAWMKVEEASNEEIKPLMEKLKKEMPAVRDKSIKIRWKIAKSLREILGVES
ncbi:hypothetical protein [Shewanella zhangzhouensis]|uniref:hypothetical protein n=1 Tax=Shewanella zhangzhouensis TaxID=2864213 RepID=UPI001C655C50|nr:hypothetical protein [Shewanella zhangzhouensis]QYK04847.1 hypothetical protein K0H63_17635 [Shewanella zhangzhouensis]